MQAAPPNGEEMPIQQTGVREDFTHSRFFYMIINQFLRLCSGAGIRPPRAMKAEQPKGLTGIMGA